KFHIEVSAGGTDVTVDRTSKQTIKEIKDNGDVVALITDEGGKYSLNGTDNDIPMGSPVTLTLNKVNQILSYKPDTEENACFSHSPLHWVRAEDRIISPDKPEKPGDS